MTLSNRKQQEEDPLFSSLDSNSKKRKKKQKSTPNNNNNTKNSSNTLQVIEKAKIRTGHSIPWNSMNYQQKLVEENNNKYLDEESEKSETSENLFDTSAPDSSEDSSGVDIIPKQTEGCIICRLCDQPIPFEQWDGHSEQCVPITSGIQWYRNQ